MRLNIWNIVYFQEDYDRIAQNCREFACDLLALCRSTDEIETLLNVRNGIEEINNCPEEVELQRVITAVSYKQKEVKRSNLTKLHILLTFWCFPVSHASILSTSAAAQVVWRFTDEVSRKNSEPAPLHRATAVLHTLACVLADSLSPVHAKGTAFI